MAKPMLDIIKEYMKEVEEKIDQYRQAKTIEAAEPALNMLFSIAKLNLLTDCFIGEALKDRKDEFLRDVTELLVIEVKEIMDKEKLHKKEEKE